MNYLVSYGHSGNTWLRYCIEYMTKRPTWGHEKFSISQKDNNFLNIDLDANPVMIKRHELKENEISDNDMFILLLRHPSQCIKFDQDVAKEFLKYYSLIYEYYKHTGGQRVVYYNEIISKRYLYWWSNTIIDKSLIDENRRNDLFDNWANHLAKSLSLYKNITNKNGCDLSDIPEIFLEDELIKGSL